ncbi:MAG TPA: hypothetical protein PK539_03015 [Candidatus Paceibacterota bacterium]|nr:hypothetical protein [Candidatus Paceibacterota bacterium]
MVRIRRAQREILERLYTGFQNDGLLRVDIDITLSTEDTGIAVGVTVSGIALYLGKHSWQPLEQARLSLGQLGDLAAYAWSRAAHFAISDRFLSRACVVCGREEYDSRLKTNDGYLLGWRFVTDIYSNHPCGNPDCYSHRLNDSLGMPEGMSIHALRAAEDVAQREHKRVIRAIRRQRVPSEPG